ncbi:LppX_LprAFG lipoprotein [Actinomadura alba]|uniref:LppX_LprAFG lipoprotein n=1 Tax=Actinomadura alba TaxID=406431 RepID=A0ABR7LGE0_9ACTN|nr:LppX_LprAFG lipoprotein [Actinomadura alba]MBC6463896.1 LppX_LprAFG lipoprotein [Actinomadura alba]
MATFRVRVIAALSLPPALVATGCTGGGTDSGTSLPEGRQVLTQASAAMRPVKSLGFTLDTEGDPPVAVKRGDIKLLKSGDAQGTLQITQGGQPIEISFVLVGQTVHYKGVTGGYQRLPRAMVAQLYDPSALLDPERGVARLLTAATGPKTEAREKVDGKDAYRVRATLPKDVAATLVPGVTADLPGQVWVAAADHRPVKLRMEMAGTGGAGKSHVTVSLNEFDANYKITPPK